MIRKVLNIQESRDRQNVHFQISERRYMDLVSTLPDIVYILDGDGLFSYMNDSVSCLGYRPAELIGKHFSTIIEEADVPKVSRDLVLPALRGRETGPAGAPKLFDERRTGSRMTRDLVVRLRVKLSSETPAVGNVRAYGETYGEIASVGYTLPEYEGSDIGTVGVIRDVTVRKLEELKLKEDLRVKDVLLKEIHHRVKNNLQIVSSLLSLQGAAIEDEASRNVFQDCQTQIQSMAMVHEQLYRSDNLQAIDMESFLNSLVMYLFRVFNVDDRQVGSTVRCSSISLGIDQAIPLALIVTELVSNSIKYGLGRTGGTISVQFEKAEAGRLCLTVRDSGEGLPEGVGIETTQTLGIQLVRALASQIGGEASWENSQGTLFTLVFPYVPPPSLELF
jgi:PAS domain S-box-containing protein